MTIEAIVSEIDNEIARLTQAKQLLVDTPTKRGPGRPPLKASSVVSNKKGRRGMSAAGRARIAAAQKARWAKIRKAAKKTSPNKAE